MDEQKFWAIVQQAHQESGGDMVEKCELVTVLISALSREEAIGFSYFFDTMMDRAYSWSLWGAAYVIHGGCGDDTFSDFRATLISSGRQVFKHGLADPDSLAANDFDEDSWFYEGYQYAVFDGVKAATGAARNRERPYPQKPSGTEWTEAEVYTLYPKLCERFAISVSSITKEKTMSMIFELRQVSLEELEALISDPSDIFFFLSGAEPYQPKRGFWANLFRARKKAVPKREWHAPPEDMLLSLEKNWHILHYLCGRVEKLFSASQGKE